MGNLERALGRNTLLIPAIAVALGIFVALKFNLHWIAGIVFLLSAVIVYILLLRFSKGPVSTFKLRNYHYVWLAISFCGVGILSATFRSPQFIDLPNSDLTITAQVEAVQEKTYGDAMLVKVASVQGINDAKGLMLKVNLLNEGGTVRVGDIVSFKGILNRIEDNPNSFYGGYKDLMNNKGIYYSCNISSNDFRIIGHKNSLGYYSSSTRNRIEEFIENTSLSKQVQNFLITLLLGDRTYLDLELRTTFAEAGVSHVLALSGMHVGIIAAIFLFLLFPINFFGKYKLRLVLAASMLWVYAFVSGMAPSTIRACIMITFTTIAIISERKRYALNALSTSVLFILLYAPRTLLDVGFQLSVVCVAALILFTDSLNLFPKGGNRYIYNVAEIVAATIIATFASWILTCYYFHSFPLSFLPANLIMLPILPIYLVVAIIYLTFSSIGLPISFLAAILNKGYELIQSVINVIGGNSAREVWVIYDAVILWMMGIILLAIYLNLHKWKPMAIAAVTCFGISLTVIFLTKAPANPGSFIITDQYNSFTVNVKTSNSEQPIDLPRYSNNELNIGNRKLLILDSKMPEANNINKSDYLIIGGSFKGDIKKAAEAAAPAAIIIHPTVRRKRESEYIDTLKHYGLNVHSLRYDKPLRVLAD